MGASDDGAHHSLTGRIRRHHFESGRFSRHPRTVVVYLPPGYDAEPARRYPVLYVQDGQNIFDAATAFAGVEWGMDEAAERLIRSGELAPLVIVGIYNTPDRVGEYTHVADPSMGGGGADTYARFLIEELKPVIDSTYRTRPGRDDTGIAGSSLGGLVSFYLGMAYPETFSRIGVVSPAVWWASAEIFNWVRAPRSPQSRIWLDMGTAEGRSAGANERLLKGVRSLRDSLTQCGWILGETLHYLEAEGAHHDESAWGARVGSMLAALFPPEPAPPSRRGGSAAPGARVAGAGPAASHDSPPDDAVAIPIDGTLDLHTFSARDVKDLVAEYIAACRERGLTRVRIIHGKGTGALRRTVHAALERMPDVESFRLASEDSSSWGATIVTLRGAPAR